VISVMRVPAFWLLYSFRIEFFIMKSIINRQDTKTRRGFLGVFVVRSKMKHFNLSEYSSWRKSDVFVAAKK
jgi:hypothetical protein